ncbi:MAG: 3-phosphoglycerate dehydrogenase [Chloroflexi bacterium]|nr:3-phosphoglycerate dehydrogenase [Chloroflexota bacterium]
MTYQVFYMARSPQSHREAMLSEEPPGFANTWIETDDPAEVTAKLAEADFVVTGRLAAEQIALASRVRLIQHFGVGYEQVDVEAAAARGIPVAITPEGTCVGVAEHTVLMILALYKHLTEAHNALKGGRWIHAELRSISLMLEEKRVGIVGLGRIGREVAKRLRPFDVELLYTDIRRLPPEEEATLGLRFHPLDELLATSDVVTLHVFLGEGSRHLIGERELALMKPTAVLINTSRGSVVDEPALYRALRDRRIAAAGLDVFVEEPTPAGNPLLALDNVLVTPHMATGTRDAMIKKARGWYTNFQRVVRGEAPINVVRPYRVVEAGASRPVG